MDFAPAPKKSPRFGRALSAAAVAAALFLSCEKEAVLLQVGPVSFSASDFEAELRLYTKGLPSVSAIQGELVKEQVLHQMILKGLAEASGLLAGSASFADSKEGVRARILQALPPPSPFKESRLKSFYQKNQKRFASPARCFFKRIVVSQKSMARSLRQRLDQKEGFETLAQLYSEAGEKGGVLAYSPGSRMGLFERACQAAAGSHSRPIPSPYGFHIFKIEKKTAAQKRSFQEARPLIIQQLRQEARKKAFSQWLSAALKSHEIRLSEAAWRRAKVRGRIEIL